MRLYEYIHRTTKSKGESEAGIFHSHEGQFICTDDTQGWFLNSHLWVFPQRCSVLLSWQILFKGSQAELKAGWRLAKQVIHLCFIMTMFDFFSLLSSTFPPLCQRGLDVEGGAGAEDSRIDFTPRPQPSRTLYILLKSSKSDKRAVQHGQYHYQVINRDNKTDIFLYISICETEG